MSEMIAGPDTLLFVLSVLSAGVAAFAALFLIVKIARAQTPTRVPIPLDSDRRILSPEKDISLPAQPGIGTCYSTRGPPAPSRPDEDPGRADAG